MPPYSLSGITFPSLIALDPPFPCTNTIVPSLRNAMLQTSREIRREYLLQRHRNYNSEQKMDGVCLLRSSPPRLAIRVIERPIPLLLNESTLRPAWTILQWGSELESPVFSFCFFARFGFCITHGLLAATTGVCKLAGIPEVFFCVYKNKFAYMVLCC
jgi:hypothetical protein